MRLCKVGENHHQNGLKCLTAGNRAKWPSADLILSSRGLQVLVYGDCAVNVSPTADQLAQIALTSADTARAFGLEPRVAMLSYSTGTSGSGPEVNLLRAHAFLLCWRKWAAAACKHFPLP